MTAQEVKSITISTIVNARVTKVWDVWNAPEHITKWNAASPDWHTPKASNDLKVGGLYVARMEAKDGSFGFDFKCTYSVIEENKRIEYTIEDGRKVKILFDQNGEQTEITETFEAESTNPIEMQRQGWQAILDNFKKYTESL